MIENKKYSVNELVQYKYSDIGEYIDENHTPKPLRNDELVKILNNYECWIKELEKENKQLKDKWFEAERQCLILYWKCKPLDNEIEELKKEIYGDV